MIPDLLTVTIARELAEEEAATAHDALSEEMRELREEVRRSAARPWLRLRAARSRR